MSATSVKRYKLEQGELLATITEGKTTLQCVDTQSSDEIGIGDIQQNLCSVTEEEIDGTSITYPIKACGTLEQDQDKSLRIYVERRQNPSEGSSDDPVIYLIKRTISSQEIVGISVKPVCPTKQKDIRCLWLHIKRP